MLKLITAVGIVIGEWALCVSEMIVSSCVLCSLLVSCLLALVGFVFRVGRSIKGERRWTVIRLKMKFFCVPRTKHFKGNGSHNFHWTYHQMENSASSICCGSKAGINAYLFKSSHFSPVVLIIQVESLLLYHYNLPNNYEGISILVVSATSMTTNGWCWLNNINLPLVAHTVVAYL